MAAAVLQVSLGVSEEREVAPTLIAYQGGDGEDDGDECGRDDDEGDDEEGEGEEGPEEGEEVLHEADGVESHPVGGVVSKNHQWLC